MHSKPLARSCALVVALSLVSVLASAQTAPAPPSPEAVVQSYLQALKDGQYATFAAFMHPEALEKFQSMILPLVEESAGEGSTDSLLPLFQGVPDVAALKKLSQAEFFAAFLSGLFEMTPQLKQAVGSGNITAIGSVAEGDTLHVVCRTAMSVNGINMNKMEVVSLKQAADGWRVLLSGEIEGIAQALRAARASKL